MLCLHGTHGVSSHFDPSAGPVFALLRVADASSAFCHFTQLTAEGCFTLTHCHKCSCLVRAFPNHWYVQHFATLKKHATERCLTFVAHSCLVPMPKKLVFTAFCLFAEHSAQRYGSGDDDEHDKETLQKLSWPSEISIRFPSLPRLQSNAARYAFAPCSNPNPTLSRAAPPPGFCTRPRRSSRVGPARRHTAQPRRVQLHIKYIHYPKPHHLIITSIAPEADTDVST